MAAVIYLADTSVLALQRREPAVLARFEKLAMEGRLGVCQISAVEFLNNAPDPNAYQTIWDSLQAHRWLDVDTEALDGALETHRLLGAKSQHRNFSWPDLVIAATAARHGATVLHYDTDFDRIAAVTGQPVEWVVPRGSL